MSVSDTSDGAKYGNAVRLPSASRKASDNSTNSGKSGNSANSGKSGSSKRSSHNTSGKAASKGAESTRKKEGAASRKLTGAAPRKISGNPKKKNSSNSAPKAPVKAASAKGAKKSAFASVQDDVLSQINDTFLKTVKDAEKAFASKKEKHKLKVIPLGGMQEIGKNMTVFEYGNDIIIVDVGVAFPEESMLGVDSVIQDYTYVLQNKDKVRGIFLTHGHEDHIGSLPFLMRELKCPLYGGKLTIELARHKLMEAGVGTRGIELVYCAAGDTIKAGSSFAVEFIRVNHSIADAFAFAIRTPIGNVIHTGIYGMGSPVALQENVIELHVGQKLDRNALLRKLVQSLYIRNDLDLQRGNFRVKGDTVDIAMAYSEVVLRVTFWDDVIDAIEEVDAITFDRLARFDEYKL